MCITLNVYIDSYIVQHHRISLYNMVLYKLISTFTLYFIVPDVSREMIMFLYEAESHAYETIQETSTCCEAQWHCG